MGACPVCGQALSIHNGRYYREEDGAPNIALLRTFESLLTTRLRYVQQDSTITLRISSKTPQYRRELAAAERLLEQAEGDLDLARLTLKVLFENPQFKRKSYLTMVYMDSDFFIALAVARSVQARMSLDNQRAASAFEKIMAQDDLFS